MIDPSTRERLHAIVRRESRSLLQYLREVPPWAATADRPALQKLTALAQVERAATDALGKHLQKERAGLANLGPYPPEFTDCNDAALHHLLPKIVREQKHAAADLEADLAVLGESSARPLAEHLLNLKRQHLAQLEALSAKPHSVTSVAAAG